MIHLDKYHDVPFGWWLHVQRAPPLPDTIQDVRNPVLAAQDVQAYADLLAQIMTDASKELIKAKRFLQCVERGPLPLLTQDPPQVFTLAHVLTFMVKLGKTKLATLHLLNDVTQRYLQRRNDEPAAVDRRDP